MRSVRRSTTGFVAGAAALSLVLASAPASAQEIRVGSAQTSLLGAELEITNLPVDVPALRVLDASTFASLDSDTNRNPLGVPFSQVLVTPLQVGDTAVGALELNSQGTQSGTSANAVSDALAPLGASVAPITASATAGPEAATALVNGAVADLTALLGTVGLDLEVSGIASNVTQSGAQALQGLRVSAIDIDLAALGIDADLLGSLPLGVLLELLDQLPLELPADVQAVVDAILATIADLQAALGDIDLAVAGIPAAAAEITSLQEQIDAVTSPDALLAAVTSTAPTAWEYWGLYLNASDEDVVILDDCTDLDAATMHADASAAWDNPPPGVASPTAAMAVVELALAAIGSSASAELATIADCLQTQVTEAAALLTDLTGQQTDALDALGLAVDGADLTDLIGVLTDLLAGIDGLDDLLAALDGLLGDIAGTSLLSVGAFDVGINAIAGATEADSSATLVCSALDVSILGETFSAPSCKDGLDQIVGALDLVDGAIGTVTDLLNTLPLADVVTIDDLKVEVFGQLTESVTTTDDGYVRAVAGMELLDLELPSITVDPTAIVDNVLGDALDGLEVPDVLGALGLGADGLPLTDVVDGTLGAAVDAVAGLDDTIAGVTGIQADLAGILSSVVDVDGLLDQLAAVTALLDGLDLGDLGTLGVALTTPGLHLVVDPSSVAEFSVTAAPAAPVAPPAPAPAPVPAPEPAPAPEPMPTTGGGLALLGLVAAGGALALRRRRD